MKKTIGKCMILTLLIVSVACGSVGAGSLAQGNIRNGQMNGGMDKDTGMEEEEGCPDVAESGQSYAYVELKREKCSILLVTDGTYGYNGLEASFHSEVYGQDRNGEWLALGVIAGSGTAYPIRYDKDGIYVTGGHFVAYYSVDWEDMRLVCKEYATATFDENGNATYVYAEDGKTERLVEGNSYLMKMADRYEKAALVDFRRVENFHGVEKKDG